MSPASRRTSLTPPPRTTVLVCPTAFKGTLSPLEASRAIARGLGRSLGAVRLLPLADGGDGTLEVLMTAFRGRRRRTRVSGPLGRPVTAAWGLVSGVPGLRAPTAVIEMARASGLALTRGRNRVMNASSRGTGELIRAALDAGAKSILIGVGGTATADGGAGALSALGVVLRDGRRAVVGTDPVSLRRARRADLTALDPRLARVKMFVLCDVRNPLLGPRGSARTFGPQKGASPAQVRLLESAMRCWARLAPRKLAARPGAGAAGATAFGLAAFAGANLVDGCAFIMKAVRWRAAARTASLLVTGEGRLDRTSFSGKVAGEVLRGRGHARAAGIFGGTPLPGPLLKRRGLDAVEILGPAGLRRPAAAVRAAAERLSRILKPTPTGRGQVSAG